MENAEGGRKEHIPEIENTPVASEQQEVVPTEKKPEIPIDIIDGIRRRWNNDDIEYHREITPDTRIH